MKGLLNYSVLGVCAGNGAVLFPFKDNLVGNSEIRAVFKTPHNNQWEANFGKIPLLQHDWDSMIAFVPTVIVGHPDCGHSSMLAYSRGKKLTDPSLNKSLLHFLSAITMVEPKLFLLENLPAFLKSYGKEGLINTLDKYNLKFLEGSVSKWGNSQITRKRLVIVGVRKDQNKAILDEFRFPKQENIKLKTFDELVASMGSLNDALCHVRLPLETKIAIFGGKKMTLREIKETWMSFPMEQRRFPANKKRMKYAPGVYRNSLDEYPLTVRKGNREFDSWGEVLTPRQRARIQGIPDSFKLIYHPDNSGYFITKANITVTKCFPYEISLWFKKRLERVINKQLLTP